jgi:hypothetical protein
LSENAFFYRLSLLGPFPADPLDVGIDLRAEEMGQEGKWAQEGGMLVVGVRLNPPPPLPLPLLLRGTSIWSRLAVPQQ